jgi:hypothetical protein
MRDIETRNDGAGLVSAAVDSARGAILYKFIKIHGLVSATFDLGTP